MHRNLNYKSKLPGIGALTVLGVVGSLGISGILASGNAFADDPSGSLTLYLPGVACDDATSPTNCAYTATAKDENGQDGLRPTATTAAYGSVVVPVGISAENVETVHIKVTSTSDVTSLVGQSDSNHTVPTLSGNVSETDFKSSDTYNNMWGIRKFLAPVKAEYAADLMSSITASSTTPLAANTDINENVKWSNVLTSLRSENFRPVAAMAVHTYGTSDNNSDWSSAYTGSSKIDIDDDKNYHGILAIEFAAKFDKTVVTDTYEGAIMVSVVAKPAEVVDPNPPTPPAGDNLFGITTMQQMNKSICDATPTPSTSASKAIVNRSAAATSNGSWSPSDAYKVGTPGSTNNAMSYANDDGGTAAATVWANELASYGANPSTYKSNYVPQTILQDTRDSKYYLVRKLADGRCWMSSNLDLALTTSFDPTDGKTDWDSSLTWSSYSSKLKATDTATGQSWNNSDIRSISSITGGKPFASRNGTSYTDATSGVMEDYRGTWYNWPAATMGTGVLQANNQAKSSICPKGWKLPTGGPSGDFQNLFTTYGQTAQAAANFPLNFSFSGRYGNGSVDYTTDYGFWWSSVASNTSYAYDLFVNSSNVNPQGSNVAQFGNAVRCISTPVAE